MPKVWIERDFIDCESIRVSYVRALVFAGNNGILNKEFNKSFDGYVASIASTVSFRIAKKFNHAFGEGGESSEDIHLDLQEAMAIIPLCNIGYNSLLERLQYESIPIDISRAKSTLSLFTIEVFNLLNKNLLLEDNLQAYILDFIFEATSVSEQHNER